MGTKQAEEQEIASPSLRLFFAVFAVFAVKNRCPLI
jgi:hypothetical protein